MRNFGLSFSSRAISLASNFVFVAATARLFSTNEVAVIAVAGILGVLMDTCKGLGLGTVLLKRLPQLDESGSGSRTALIYSYLVYSLAPPALLAACAFAAAPLLSRYFFGADEYTYELRLGLAMSFATVLTNSNILVFQALQRFGQLAVLTTVTAALQRLLPCVLAFGLRGMAANSGGGSILADFLAWTAVLSVAGMLVTCGPLWLILQAPGLRLMKPAEFWPESRHFYYTGMLRYGATQLDQLFVATLFTPQVLAVYYVLRRFYSIGVVAIGAMIDALVPDLSQQAGSDREAARTRLDAWVGFTLFIGTIGGALLAGNGHGLSGWILGAAYVEDPFLVLLFAISAVTYFLFGVAHMDLVLFDEPRKSFQLSALAAASNLVLSPLCAALLGVRGLPLAMALSYVAGLEIVRRYRDTVAWRPWRLSKGVVVIGAASAISALVQFMGGALWLEALTVNAWVAVFALVSWRQVRPRTMRRACQAGELT